MRIPTPRAARIDREAARVYLRAMQAAKGMLLGGRWRRRAMAVLATFALSSLTVSCDLETRTKVAAGDVDDLLGGKVDEALMNAVILFPKPSDDVKEDLVSFLSMRFRRFENLRPVERGTNSFLSAEVSFPMRRRATRPGVQTPDLITFYVANEAGERVVSMRINAKRFAEIASYVLDKTMQEISLGDLEISIAFVNTSGAELSVRTGYGFADGRPILAPEYISLAASRSLDIRLSDVLRDSIAAREEGEVFRYAPRPLSPTDPRQ
jgi:hypothetical protein